MNGAVTARPLAADRETVKVMLAAVSPASPSATALASATDSTGRASSSVMAMAMSAMVNAPDVPLSVSVSLSSSRVSLVGVSVKSAVALDSPAGMVILNEAGDAA